VVIWACAGSFWVFVPADIRGGRLLWLWHDASVIFVLPTMMCLAGRIYGGTPRGVFWRYFIGAYGMIGMGGN